MGSTEKLVLWGFNGVVDPGDRKAIRRLGPLSTVMDVHVLRLGHRPSRDRRLSTHVILAARAFGASGATYTGERDPGLEESIGRVVSEWGGSFTFEYSESWRKVVSGWGGRVVHLTMYGLPVQEIVPKIRGDGADILAVVGGAKVPGEMYGLVDWNVGVTSQPHSEVSALAVFLHELMEGGELDLSFPGARMKVVPQAKGKRVESGV
jgi:tRNA (cytidine56-2'-O)-methyltransferase